MKQTHPRCVSHIVKKLIHPCTASFRVRDAALVNHIAAHIKKIFLDNAGADLAIFSKSLTELMPRLYAGDPFTSYPHSDVADLYTEFLVAARPNYREKVALFQINSSLVEEVSRGIRVIGCGTMQETAFELDVMNLNMYDSAPAALYLIYEAKRHYSYVGGVTHIHSIPNPGPSGHPPETERRLDQGLKESLFAQLRAWHHQMIVTAGSRYVSTESFALVMDSFQKDIRRIRDEFEALEKREQERDKEHTREQAEQFRKMMESLVSKRAEP
ncbi:MAG: hypothetical protein JWO91_462 [Acidobacteriaceae bacterium]|nr:hypothetical protein [Acidobacteriaceae bacterium]